MLFVKTRLDKSAVNGIGLFADQLIASGSVVYKPSPDLDLNIADGDFQKLDTYSQEQIRHYGYFDKNQLKWHLAFDDIRFCNHSDMGNISIDMAVPEYQLIATKDIKIGEELLQNYKEFEDPGRKI